MPLVTFFFCLFLLGFSHLCYLLAPVLCVTFLHALIYSTCMTWRKKKEDFVYISFRRRLSGHGLTWSGRRRRRLSISTRRPQSTATGEDFNSKKMPCLQCVCKDEVETRGAQGIQRTQAGPGVPTHLPTSGKNQLSNHPPHPHLSVTSVQEWWCWHFYYSIYC